VRALVGGNEPPGPPWLVPHLAGRFFGLGVPGRIDSGVRLEAGVQVGPHPEAAVPGHRVQVLGPVRLALPGGLDDRLVAAEHGLVLGDLPVDPHVQRLAFNLLFDGGTELLQRHRVVGRQGCLLRVHCPLRFGSAVLQVGSALALELRVRVRLRAAVTHVAPSDLVRNTSLCCPA
jgi:hypothetical protein